MAATIAITGPDIEFELPSGSGHRLAASYRPVDGKPAEQVPAVLLLHGFLSDRHAGGRFDRLTRTYHQTGVAVLRIDLSGFGESEGDVVDGDDLLADAHSALNHLDERGHRVQAVHGQSLGSSIALRIAPHRPAVHTLVLTGALTGGASGDRPYWYRNRDVHLPITGSSRRTAVTVNRTRPKLGATGTQKDLLTAVDVPVLVVHGDTGDQERRLAGITRAGRHWLPAGSELVTIPGADHTFNDRRAELDALIRPWARRHLLSAAGILARPVTAWPLPALPSPAQQENS
jgi:alpha/beta superfamily hydrolase